MDIENTNQVDAVDEVLDVVVDNETTQQQEPEFDVRVEEKTAEHVVKKDAADEAAEQLKLHIERAKKAEEEAARERALRVQAENKSRYIEETARERETKAYETAAQREKESEEIKLKQAREEAIRYQEAGELEKAEDARQRVFEARMRINNIEQKAESAVVRQQERQEPVVQGRLDPVTGAVFTEKTQTWIDRNIEKWKDPEFRADAAGADAAAIARGLMRDTDAYFAFVDRRLGLSKQENEVQQQPEPQKTVSQRAPSAAPSRNVPNTPGSGKKTIRLTGEQRAVAQDIINSAPHLFKGMSPEQVYAKEIAALQAERGEKWWESQG